MYLKFDFTERKGDQFYLIERRLLLRNVIEIRSVRDNMFTHET